MPSCCSSAWRRGLFEARYKRGALIVTSGAAANEPISKDATRRCDPGRHDTRAAEALLPMIGMSGRERVRPIELLDEEHAGKAVRKRHRRQRHRCDGAGLHVRCESVGAADDEREIV